jgi:hypothetical protein
MKILMLGHSKSQWICVMYDIIKDPIGKLYGYSFFSEPSIPINVTWCLSEQCLNTCLSADLKTLSRRVESERFYVRRMERCR